MRPNRLVKKGSDDEVKVERVYCCKKWLWKRKKEDEVELVVVVVVVGDRMTALL